MMILLLFGTVIAVHAVYKGPVERCPDHRQERILRAKIVCSSVEQYHCLYDDELQLVEICQAFKQLPPGQYPKYSTFGDDIYYEECPAGKYQPWPAKSYEITECVFVKSTCSAEGQLLCNNGTTSTDSTCNCDYKKGYILRKDTCCSPTENKDCVCYKAECSDKNQELNKEYICVNKCTDGYERIGDKDECVIISEVTTSNTSLPISTTTKEQEIAIVFVDRFSKHTIFICITVLALAVVIVGKFGCYCLASHYIKPKRRTFDYAYHCKVYKLLKAAADGNLDIVKELKEEGYIDLDDVDYDKRSALHLAASEGREEVVSYLLRHHSGHLNAKDRWGFTAVDDAIRHKEQLQEGNKRFKDYENIIEIFENHKTKDGEADKTSFREQIASELINAAGKGNKMRLEKLLGLKTDMDLSNMSGYTALQAAVDRKQAHIIEYLLETCEVSPFVKFQSRRPEGEFVEQAREQILDNPNLEKMAPVDADSDDKTFQMLQSASRGELRKMRGYKNAGFDKNAADYDKRTALHVAVSDHQEHIVKFLIEEWKVDIHLRDRWGRSALDEATDEGKRDILQIFQNNYKDITDTLSNDYKTFQLLKAGKEGNVEKLKRLHLRRYDMNMRNYDGRTALHLAVAEDQLKAVEFLVNSCKVRIDIPDRGGRTPLSDANVNNKNYIDIKAVIEGAENKNQVDSKELQHDINPIYEVNATVEKGDIYKLGRLDAVYMDAGDYLKETPLHVAAAKGQMKMVVSLVENKNVSLFVRNSFWETPIRLARRKRKHWKKRLKIQLKTVGDTDKTEVDTDLVKSIDHGTISDLEESNKQDKVTNLATSTKRGKEKESEWVDYDSDLQNEDEKDIPKDYSESENHILKRIQAFEEVEMYLRSKMRSQITNNVEEKDSALRNYKEQELTFLFLNKTYRGDIAAVKRYVAYRPAIVDYPDYDQRTALHIAVAEGHYHIVIYFLKDLKVKPDKKDRWKRTPYQDAKFNKDVRMVRIFKKYSSVNKQ